MATISEAARLLGHRGGAALCPPPADRKPRLRLSFPIRSAAPSLPVELQELASLLDGSTRIPEGADLDDAYIGRLKRRMRAARV